MKREDVYMVSIILVPLVIVGLTWIFLNPNTFWQKLVMLPVSVLEYIIMGWVVIKICEAIDR